MQASHRQVERLDPARLLHGALRRGVLLLAVLLGQAGRDAVQRGQREALGGVVRGRVDARAVQRLHLRQAM